MTRDELNIHIEQCDLASRFSSATTISCSRVADWLKDIRDNGITESKEYMVQVIDGNEDTYLNVDKRDGSFSFASSIETTNKKHILHKFKLIAIRR